MEPRRGNRYWTQCPFEKAGYKIYSDIHCREIKEESARRRAGIPYSEETSEEIRLKSLRLDWEPTNEERIRRFCDNGHFTNQRALTLWEHMQELTLRPKQSGLGAIPDAAMACIWSFVYEYWDAQSLSKTCRSFRISYERVPVIEEGISIHQAPKLDCDKHLHLRFRHTGHFCPDKKFLERDQEKVLSIDMEHRETNDPSRRPIRKWDNQLQFPPTVLHGIQELKLVTENGYFEKSTRFATLKKLDLRCASKAIPYDLGDMLPVLEKLDLTCWSDPDAWRRLITNSPFPAVTHLSLAGATFDFVLSSDLFPKLLSLEIGDVGDRAYFNLERSVIDSAFLTPRSSMCLVAEDAYIRKVIVGYGELPRTLNPLSWLSGIRIGELDFYPVFSSVHVGMLVPMQPTIVHLVMDVFDLEGLCIGMRRLLGRGEAMACDLLDIDLLSCPNPLAGSAGHTTRGRIAVTTDGLKQLPKRILLRCSHDGTDPISVPGYTEAREYSETVGVNETIVMNLSIPEVFLGMDSRKTFG